MAFGCSDDSNTGGPAGGGTGGTPGSDGAAGVGGGAGGGGGSAPACLPTETMCMNGGIDPTEPSCVLAAPPVEDDACVGDESH